MIEDNLLSSDGFFEYFFENHPDGMCVVDLKGRFLRANTSALNMLGYTLNELLQTPWSHVIQSNVDPSNLDEHFRDRTEWVLLHHQGHLVYVRVTCLALVSGGIKQGTIMTFEDITEQKALRRKLLGIQELFVFISEKSENIISSLSPQGVFTYVSPNVKVLLGYSPEEVIGKPAEVFNPPETNVELLNYRNSLASDGDTRRFTGRLRHKNGEHRWYETTVQYIRDPSGAIIQTIGVGRDITDRKEAEEKIEYLAYHDPLTDLPNRRLFNQCVRGVLGKTTKEHTLILLDLDNFKDVNDTFGHEVGDLLLIQIAKRLKHIVGANGIVARLGGDEFIIFYYDEKGSTNLTARIEDAVSEPIVIHDHVIHMTSSMGVSRFPMDGNSVESLMRNADIEMYRAKHR